MNSLIKIKQDNRRGCVERVLQVIEGDQETQAAMLSEYWLQKCWVGFGKINFASHYRSVPSDLRCMERDMKSTASLAANKTENERHWFCVQTHPKHEHIAAGNLSKVGGIEVFNPQMRIRRATKRGPVWFTESAFPGYVFTRFDLQIDLDAVRYSSSVSKVVHFKSGYPSIPDLEVNELRTIFGVEDLVVLSPDVSTGDTVRIVGGAFHDLLAVVQEVRPAGQRVQALLDFLGRMTLVELNLQSVVVEDRRQARPHPLGRTEVFSGSKIKSAV